MSSPVKNPEDVAASVLKRAEVSKMARTLQNRLALAQFKAKNGWQDLTLVEIEPKLDERLRLQRPSSSGDMLSDTSSSSAYSDFQYPRALASSPMKGPIFSDALQPSSGSSSGHRKRAYNHSFNGNAFPSSHNSARKRFRQSPARNADFFNPHTSWKDDHQLAQSSPIKPRKQHFTTAAGPDLSFYHTSHSIQEENFLSTSSEEDDLLPLHSFQMPEMQRQRHVSPPRTPPPMRSRPLNTRSHTTHGRAQHPQHQNPLQNHQGHGQEGADLLLYLATSPSPAQPRRERFTGGNTFLPTHSHSKSFTDSFITTEAMKCNVGAAAASSNHQSNTSMNSISHHSNTSISRNNETPMQPPQTPPSKNMALPSSMMTTPGGSNGFGVPTTPGQGWDFAEFVNITPSPAQKAWRTPRLGLGGTPRMGSLGDVERLGDENVNPNTGGRPQRTPRTRANGKFEGFMQPPMASPMLGSRAVGSRVGGEMGGELETLR